jgi:phospholipase C
MKTPTTTNDAQAISEQYMNFKNFAILLTLVAIAGCAQNSTIGPPSAGWSRIEALQINPNGASGKIQHVVIIFQENRSTNDLFNSLKGANTTRVGLNSYGQEVQLQQQLLTAPYDISHKHAVFKTEYANGSMNGWNLVRSKCKPHEQCPPPDIRAYGYVPKSEVKPYYFMARHYAFGNNMFQTNQGPSFPAHQYILSGTSTISDGSNLRASENGKTPTHKLTGGCDSPQGSHVKVIDQYGNENQKVYPCFNRNSLIQLIEAQNLSWHYYEAQLGAGLWKGPDAISPVRNSPEFTYDVVAPPSRVLTDISSGNLANVVWVTPTSKASDHGGITDGTGPSWVASVVNAIGESKYWDNTAIFVTWDDWGGWYDPVSPPQYNSYELGFRVPLIVISAYAKQDYISTKQHEFGSILKFTEKTFDLGSLGTTDVRADDLFDCFDFSKPPRKFIKIPAPHDASYFLHLPRDNETPDDDF